MLGQVISTAKGRLLFAACSLCALAVLGVLVCDRLAGDISLLDLGRASGYAITQTGNHIVVQVVSPILY